MKKLLSTLLCLSVMTGIIPTAASAKSEPIYLENGADHWEMTSISGDVNYDGKLNIADALILQKCFMDDFSYDEDFKFDKSKLDVNFDGYFDSFDLVYIRKLILNPEQAEKQTFAVDILNTDAEILSFEEKYDEWGNGENFSSIITSYDEMFTYLETLITDSDELDKYLEKYDKAFFEDNNLFLEPFIQERGNGIFKQLLTTVRLRDKLHDYVDGDVVACVMYGAYEKDKGLYPVTNTKMLAQVAVPKSQTNAEDKFMYIDMTYAFSEQEETVSYSDGEHEIIITQKSGWGIDSNVYIKDDDSFVYVTSIYPDFYFQNGELSTDDYKITFCNDAFIIDYKSEFNEWKKLQVSYDDEKFVHLDGSQTPPFYSPDGTSKLHFCPEYYNSGQLFHIYLEEPDGHLKYLGKIDTLFLNPPFNPDGEWSKDSNGNDVFSTGKLSITWLEDSVRIDYQCDDKSWDSCTVSLD